MSRRRKTLVVPLLHHLPKPIAGRGLRATIGRGPTITPRVSRTSRAAAGRARCHLRSAPPPAAPPALKLQRLVKEVPPPPVLHGLCQVALVDGRRVMRGGRGGGGDGGAI
jgi:hypothetical protein